MPDRHSRCGSTYYKCYTDRFAYCKRFEEKDDAEEEMKEVIDDGDQ